MTTHPTALSLRAAALLASVVFIPASLHAQTLSGWAALPGATYAPGPTSGQFKAAPTGALAGTLPLTNQQPVQGFSGILPGPTSGTYLVLPDNGFGGFNDSQDMLQRVYALRPDFRTANGGTGTVSAVDFNTGQARSSFDTTSFINLRDPDQKLTYGLVASQATYPTDSGASTIAVDSTIAAGRLLTGRDLDPESMRRDSQGNFWFGDEFGPFLIKTDSTGKVLRSEIPLPGVKAPQNPTLNGATANLGSSRGFEGMAINASGTQLFTLMEGEVTGDPSKNLRINTFNLSSETFNEAFSIYKLEATATAIGDMTAIDDHSLLVLERNGITERNDSATNVPLKKVFLVDLEVFDVVDGRNVLRKTEIANLMALADPNDLNGDGSTTFTFPFNTIEDILLVDANTLLIANDNNYPQLSGRDTGLLEGNEFILVSLPSAIPEPSTYAMCSGLIGLLVASVRRPGRRSVQS